MATPLQILLGTDRSPQVARLRSTAVRQYEPLPRLVGGDVIEATVTLIGSTGAIEASSGSGDVRMILVDGAGSTLAAATVYTAAASAWTLNLDLNTVAIGDATTGNASASATLLVQQAVSSVDWRTWGRLPAYIYPDSSASYDTPTPAEDYYTKAQIDAIVAEIDADIAAATADIASLSVQLVQLTSDVSTLDQFVTDLESEVSTLSGEVLRSANNLDDVADAATARTNLGIVSASTAAEGLVELATDAETQAGSSSTLAVTPAGLASVTATTTRAGLVETATSSEAEQQTDSERALTAQAHIGSHAMRYVHPIVATTTANTQTRTASGGGVSQINGWMTNRLSLPTTSGAEACASHVARYPSTIQTGFWARRMEFSGVWWAGSNPLENVVYRAYFRKALVSSTASPAAGVLALDGFALSFENVGGTGTARIEAYASSTLKTPVEFTTGFDQFGTSFNDWHWRLLKEEDGTVHLYINGAFVGSSAAGFAPASGNLGVSSYAFGSEITNTGTASGNTTLDVSAYQINVSGF